ncbi:MAG: hypothetical protein ACI9OU_000015 [Candidatus Promineifilaceae bacterium]|jgi:hypothetical protein
MKPFRAGPRLERKHDTFYIYVVAAVRQSSVRAVDFWNDTAFTCNVAFAGRDGC